MQRRIGVSTAAACCSALRRVRHVSARSLYALAPVHPGGNAFGAALLGTVRHQSATAERRFHCSVCKKAFRLEMAAKLHLQQVHSGEGSVEAGAGPGQGEEQAPPTPVGVLRNAPPQAPTVVSPLVSDAHERSTRREKPAPKPLHQAEREVPGPVMEKMLSVWDDIGVKQIGDQFVHSSMVMRVFAARPSDSAEPLYGTVNPEGENPFSSRQHAPVAVSSITTNVEDANIYSVSMSDAYAMASGESFGPLRPARCPNPFHRKPTKDVARAATRVELVGQQTAPVTPFGQLPVFGQASPASAPTMPCATQDSSTKVNTVVSSPFATSANDSPFAGTTDFPFSGQRYSPFASAGKLGGSAPVVPGIGGTSAAPYGALASPFAGAGGAGTDAGEGPTSPLSAVPSPFTASPQASSPFAAVDTAAVASGALGSDGALFAPISVSPARVPAEETPAPTHVCTICEKSFSTYDGLRMHSKAKHAKELPKAPLVEKHEVPDLPAFIPSPVDLTTTSPFGSSSQRSAWTEVELTPYAQSVSNITVAGRILETETTSDGTLFLSILVPDPAEKEAEVIPVRCSSDSLKAGGHALVHGDHVFACGSLRVFPVTDKKTQRTYCSAVVYVSFPTGIIAKLN
ncbi:hypothetical protein JKF63_00991 [Porcisia hertigi]|uniref:C2H2-type domain-containing protein n=1 Tax=Porcisia hertigi TaxID=2761500 RepID=A0A836HG41_9TRYP|nr:hypothetical protein JKF63_00991 [Porcisia hertigi]